MDLNGARLSEVLVNGSRGQLQASASISAGKAVIFYEDLMRWIDRESSPLRVPFFPHYDFDLKIKQSENVQLHAEFFKMNIEPNMYIKIRPKTNLFERAYWSKRWLFGISQKSLQG